MEEMDCCCSGKKKERTEAEYRSLIHRLSRIEGQVRGMTPAAVSASFALLV